MTATRPPLLVMVLVIGLANVAGARPSTTRSPAPVKAGAYYFEGWTGKTDDLHLPPRLRTEFFDREPVWGWHTGTVDIMRRQIDYAADHGVGFFAFCWYWPEGESKETPLNDGLRQYLAAPNNDRLEFCLLVANHGGYNLYPKDWDSVCDAWVELFRDPKHLTVDGKPLLIFFSQNELRRSLGGTDAVATSFRHLRAKVKAAGLPGVTIAACCAPGPENGWADLEQLKREGYDVFTGYNYHGYPMKGDQKIQAFATMVEGHEDLWDRFAQKNVAPYIPVVTTGWDRRPWQDASKPVPEAYYPDRTPPQVSDFVRRAVRWLDAHPDRTTMERILLLYAWNEIGEGGFLTPTKSMGEAYLDAVQSALPAPAPGPPASRQD